MHENHRKRVREAFRNNGMEHMSDHNILEMLLFFSVPRIDTNELAHRLIETFGSLSAVLEASYGDLIKVPGIGESSAVLITMMPQLFRRYSFDKVKDRKCIKSPQEAGEYIITKYFGITTEKVGMICIDSKGRINNFVFIAEGSLRTANIDVRRTAETAFRNMAESIILCHNHPNGLPMPSRDDVATTKELIEILNTLDIKVSDHIIVSDNEYFSMAQSEKLLPIFLKQESSLKPKSSFSLYNSEYSEV